MAKKFYLKERHNPQFKDPYYIKMGQLTKAQARGFEKAAYGGNYMLPYNTEQDYLEDIEKLIKDGFVVNCSILAAG